MNDAQNIRKYLNLVESTITSTPNQLMEDLGSLKQVDPELLKSISEYKSGVPKFGGRDSELRTVELKNGAQAIRTLEENRNTLAVIVTVDGTQVIALSKGDVAYNSAMHDLIRKWEFNGIYNTPIGDYSKSNTQKMAWLIKQAKAHGNVVGGFAIMRDVSRDTTQRDRQDARSGAIAIIPKDEVKYKFKKELMQRLQAFKTSKSPTITSPDAVIDAFSESIPDVLNISGYGYEQSRSYLSNRDTVNKSEMEIRWSLIKTDRDKINAMRRDVFGTSGMGEDDYKKALKDLPPEDITVYFKLDGVTLVPVKMESSSMWY